MSRFVPTTPPEDIGDSSVVSSTACNASSGMVRLYPGVAGVSALVMGVMLCHSVHAQRTLDVAVDPSVAVRTISPYVYGSNGQSDDRYERVTARRLGGNRITGYNWENNASNAGLDYLHQSDNYLTYLMPPWAESVPGIVLTSFHDTSLATGCYLLLTLPAAGFVARDKSGPVSIAQTAPSARWDSVVFIKEAPFTSQPNTADGVVYVDEEINLLVQRYGRSDGSRGIHGYAVDNEPSLWPDTHPRIHPTKTTVAEIIRKGIDVGRTVKGIDPSADVFGPASYGFTEYQNFQSAPDWGDYSSYGTFIDAYLAKMKEAEVQYGRRVLDVLDLHWYPEALGFNAQGGKTRIAMSNNNDPGVAYARMQAPRSLWDSSYTEDSWIGRYFSPVALVPRMQASIAERYPGTKLAFTELNYGGDHHISGGIAMADVLGIFGREGVYMANYWGPIEGYVSAAYHLYRGDDDGTAFGAEVVSCSFRGDEHAAVYASRGAHHVVHLIVINRDTAESLDVRFMIAGNVTYSRALAFGFTSIDTVTRMHAPFDVENNRLAYMVPPLSAWHIVATPAAGRVQCDARAGITRLDMPLPNPASSAALVRYALAERSVVRISLHDALGRDVRTILTGTIGTGEHEAVVNTGGLPAGGYTLRLAYGAGVLTRRIVVAR